MLIEFAIFVFIEWRFNSECGEHVHLEVLVFVVVKLAHGIFHGVVDSVDDVEADTLTEHCVMAVGVNHLTLCVHHVVVFQCVLTNTEVVFFHTLLCVFDTLGHHWRFDSFAIFQAEAVEQLHNLFACEETHHLIFKRHEEH